MAKTNVATIKKEGAPAAASSRRPMSLFEEFDRFFESALPTRGWPTHWPTWPEFFRGQAMPPVDIIDREDEVVVRAEVPGVKKDELDVTVTDNRITIKGEYRKEDKEERGDYHRSETSYGSFARTLELPAEVDGTKGRAKFEDGVLEVTLPKREGSRKRSIKVE
ncbi:MAG: Hsp20/alpha crystallin family protein [Gammaproteobacteria bacterium]